MDDRTASQFEKPWYQISFELGVSPTVAGNYAQKHGIKTKHTIGFSHKAVEWLEHIMKEQNIHIQHIENIGEYRIPGTNNLKADGYCMETNTIYEFYGDLWHGNPKVFKPNHMIFYKTAAELCERTLEREKIIKNLGYNLVTIWESDWKS